MVNNIYMIGGVILFVLLIIFILKRFGTEKKILPPLTVEETQIFNNGVYEKVKIFKTCGREFKDKPSALNWAKQCAKPIR